MGRMLLPPGFRFHPTDMELIMYYLKRKVMGKKLIFDAVTELNIYKFAPWDLPDKCLWKSKDLEWYFFCPREKKYSSGARSNRATEIGYWKITGKDRLVTYNQRTVGRIKTLIFYTGHAPQGERTDWVMHEYRLEDKNLVDVVQDAYMLCKIFQKSGLGPKNGEQHGAPFNEEEWSDMEEISVESPPVACQIFSNGVPPSHINNSNAVSLSVPGDSLVNFMPEPDRSADEPRNIDIQPAMKEICVETSAVDHHILPNYAPLGTIGSSAAMCMTDPGNSHVWPTSTSGPSPDGPLVMDMPDNPSDPDKDILGLLNMFTEDINLPPAENNVMEKFERNGHLPRFDENSIFNGLGNLNDGIELRDFGFNISTTQDAAFNPNPVLMGEENTPFLELNDLSIPLQCPFEIGELDWIRTGSIYAAPTYGMSIGMDEFYSGCANPCFAEVSRWNDYSALLERPHLVGNNLELGKDNCMVNFEAHGCDAVTGNEVPFSVTEPDGSGTAEQIQRRGERQTNLQLLLDSVSAHMIRAEQLIDSFPQSGSSIDFKAEVTLKVGECTKDALLHNMEEFGRISIPWGSQPIVDVMSSRQYIIYALLYCFWMILGKIWILLISEMPLFFDIVCSFVWFDELVEFDWIYFFVHQSMKCCPCPRINKHKTPDHKQVLQVVFFYKF